MLGLNTLLHRLNGSSADPLALGAELAEIKRQRAAIPGKRADLKLRRLEALRNDDDKEARNIERQLTDLDRDEDRLADSEINVSRQASAALAAEDARAADAASALYLEQSEDVAAKIQAADVAAMQQRQTWDKHQRVLARLGIAPLGAVLILGEGHGVRWAIGTRRTIAEIRASREQRTAVQQPVSAPRRAQPQPAQESRARPRMTDSARQVSLALPDGSAPRRGVARPPDDEPLTPGQVPLIAVRPGLEVAGRRYGTGESFRADPAEADKLLRAGAVDLDKRFVEAAPEGAPPGNWHDDSKERAEFQEQAHRGDAGK
jgi:hypothetical protein